MEMSQPLTLATSPIFLYFNSCALLIIDTAYVANYPTIHLPFLLATNTTDYLGRQLIAKRLIHLNCLLISVFRQPYPAQILPNPKLQDIILAVQRLQSLGQLSPSANPSHRSTPAYVLTFQWFKGSSLKKMQRLRHEEEIFASMLYREVPATVPSYFLYYREGSNGQWTIHSGRFLCKATHCDQQKNMRWFFSCVPLTACASRFLKVFNEAVNLGRNVIWHFNASVGADNSTNKNMSLSPVMKNVIDFMKAGMNSSISLDGNLFSSPSFGEAYYIDYHDFPTSGVRFHFTGNVKAYHFITSDSARGILPSMHSYFKPFSWGLWVMSLVIMVSLAIVTAIPGGNSLSRVVNYATDTLIWLYATLLDQSRSQSRNSITGLLVALGWIPFALILSSLYHATWQSQHIAAFSYEIKWKTIEELLSANFTLYLPMPRQLFGLYLGWNPRLDGNRHSAWQAFCAKHTCEECRFIQGVQKARNYTAEETSTRLKLFDSFELDDKIVSTLSQPRTALITNKWAFDIHWQVYFKTAMEKHSWLKFHHNKNVKDEFLRVAEYYWIDDVNPHYGYVPQRFQSLFEVGIYKKYVLDFIGPVLLMTQKVKLKEAEPAFKRLSLKESDIGLFFKVICVCWSCCCVVFVIEVVLVCVHTSAIFKLYVLK